MGTHYTADFTDGTGFLSYLQTDRQEKIDKVDSTAQVVDQTSSTKPSRQGSESQSTSSKPRMY